MYVRLHGYRTGKLTLQVLNTFLLPFQPDHQSLQTPTAFEMDYLPHDPDAYPFARDLFMSIPLVYGLPGISWDDLYDQKVVYTMILLVSNPPSLPPSLSSHPFWEENAKFKPSLT